MGALVGVVPVKPFGGALKRLSAVLGPEERRALQRAMLADVLGALAGAALGPVVVVTADPEAAALAAGAGARGLPDHQPRRGMNAAVRIGQREAARIGAEGALVLVADLPRIAPADLVALAAAAPAGRSVTMAPSRDGTGTNALLVRPPTALSPALGPGSLSRHLAGAATAGLETALVARAGLALDVDTPEDLAVFLADPGGGEAARACARLGLAERLAAGALR
jgi:2-phospho-L-lactate guanylyltransferase